MHQNEMTNEFKNTCCIHRLKGMQKFTASSAACAFLSIWLLQVTKGNVEMKGETNLKGSIKQPPHNLLWNVCYEVSLHLLTICSWQKH